jgi:hypothetical protein
MKYQRQVILLVSAMIDYRAGILNFHSAEVRDFHDSYPVVNGISLRT